MPTWSEFAASERAEVREGDGGWWPLEGGGRLLAEAGERLLSSAPAGIALLGTVSGDGRPRIHPFMPRILDGRLYAWVISGSPKARDLERRAYTIHTSLADEDEEFWVGGRARPIEDVSTIEATLAAMAWAKPGHERLFEFDLDRAGWTTWGDFGTPNHRPRHHRWIAIP
jgi:hypothetical protein